MSTFSAKQLAGSAETQCTKIDLYDLGASQHTYVQILP